MNDATAADRISGFYRRHRGKFWLAQAALLLAVGGVVGSSLGGHSMPGDPAVAGAHAGHQEAASEAPKIWTCSMHPQIRRNEPGKCPLCGMDLVPVKKSAGGIRTISISAGIKKLMNVQTVPVTRRYVTAEVRMVGKVDYDETRLAQVTAWVAGRLDRLYVDYTGVEVKKGDHMVYIYSEELYTAQEELITALESRVERATSRFLAPIDLAESAREKLRLLGITDQQIEEIEQRRKPTDHLTIYSPASGIVIEKLLEEGDRVRTGDRIYTVADLNHLWVQMDAYESDLAWLRYGQAVEFTTEAYPGEVFHGQIAFINPVLNEATRTVKVRVNVANENGRLKPEMFVRAIVRSKIASGGRVLDASLAGKWISPMHPEIVKDKPGDCDVCSMPLVKAESLGYVTAEPTDSEKPLVIPVTAALLTGTRAIVYVQVPNAEEPTYEGKEIVLGPRAGGYYLVRSGLKEGELVVTNGNFKLDSALQISAKPSMMTPEGGGGGGHNHGGKPMSAADGKNTKASGHAGMSVPPQLESALGETIESVKLVAQAVEASELEKIRAAFQQLSQHVSSVDPDQLTGDMKLQLREILMLLTNDAVEGENVQSIKDADRVYLLAKRNAERLQQMFGLAQTDQQKAEASLQVTAEFRDQLSLLINPYLSIGKALFDEDNSAALPAVTSLQQVIDAVDSKSLEGATAARWDTERVGLASIATRLAKAKDIDSLRTAFALLSDELLSLQRTFGFPDSDQLFEVHCPMAFDGRGASWIQSDDAVRNPFYGVSSAMKKCASRVEPLGVKKQNPSGSSGD